MQCPACDNELVAVEIDKIKAATCQGGCRGLWLDSFNMKKLADANDTISEKFMELQKAKPPIEFAMPEHRHQCPVCRGIVMMRRFASVKREAVIHECAGCGGCWLDNGEIERMRNEFESAEEKEAATNKMLSSLFSALDTTKSKSKSKRKEEQ